MALTLRLTNPHHGMWFSRDIRHWVGEHPEYNNYFDVIDEETIIIKTDRLEIGREESNKVVLDNVHLFSEVSRKHALFAREGGRWFLVDQGSKYGTWVRRKGSIIDVKNAEGPIRLEQGDEIFLGKLENKFLGGPVTLLVVSV